MFFFCRFAVISPAPYFNCTVGSSMRLVISCNHISTWGSRKKCMERSVLLEPIIKMANKVSYRSNDYIKCRRIILFQCKLCLSSNFGGY
jgi:hypothetical protein